MKNKNLYTMKQPELGQRILELRKSKGLTQEELVDMCNINVRTIQRIEAGEVSPRNFTIRTILEALGVESENFFKSEIEEEKKVRFSVKDVNILKIGWIGALLFTVFTSVTMFLEFTVLYDFEYSQDEILIRTLLGVVTLGSLFVFMRAYKILGERLNQVSLVYGSYIYFSMEAISILLILILTIFNFDTDTTEMASGVLLIILLGTAELIMGLAILKLKEHFGSFANTIGIIKIVYGIMLITVILAVFAIFIAVPLLILETIFLYQISKKIDE